MKIETEVLNKLKEQHGTTKVYVLAAGEQV